MTRVGVVLGAGGITGIAWLLGALEAVQAHTGWDPGTADVIAGTSAGAIAAVVVAGGIDNEQLLTMAEEQAVLDAAIADAVARRPGGTGGVPGMWPGSLALGISGLVSTDPRRRITSLTGFLPRGLRSGDEIRGLTRDAVAPGWPAERRLLLNACDFRTGDRVTFGADGAPPAPLEDAVVASCAIPGYYRPVRVGGRDYVDGGLHSLLNADVLNDAGCDVVLCLSPFASRERASLADTTIFGAARRASARNLANEAALLRATGTQVVTIEPAAAELHAMGLNMMDRSRSRRVLDTAAAGVGARIGALLDGIELPAAGARGLSLAA
ncbi:patatin-like phospholipase family protein [Paraconexibacter sp. AEG42_29]